MRCFHPLRAWQMRPGARVVFSPVGRVDGARKLDLRCGRCIGCRLTRSCEWAMRCVHEAKISGVSCFVTLTYSDKFLPKDGCLDHRHFQLFMKRLREFSPVPIRFYMCGEYGEVNWRPHYHCLIFGFDFLDKVKYKKVGDYQLYTSKKLTQLWGLGDLECQLIGDVSFESAAYCARYCMGGFNEYVLVDDVTGELRPLRKEYARMSNGGGRSGRGGIGAPWLKRFWSDVFPEGEVIARGVKGKSPRYYDGKLKEVDLAAYEALLLRRSKMADRVWEEGSTVRLEVQERVAQARVALFNRESV